MFAAGAAVGWSLAASSRCPGACACFCVWAGDAAANNNSLPAHGCAAAGAWAAWRHDCAAIWRRRGGRGPGGAAARRRKAARAGRRGCTAAGTGAAWLHGGSVARRPVGGRRLRLGLRGGTEAEGGRGLGGPEARLHRGRDMGGAAAWTRKAAEAWAARRPGGGTQPGLGGAAAQRPVPGQHGYLEVRRRGGL
ncbi:hypothetical protein BS78_04G060200 [Paspalum vaginatum]|nr:hypothetical protein BS78_04G060200 [Paspalum vaginatum]